MFRRVRARAGRTAPGATPSLGTGSETSPGDLTGLSSILSVLDPSEVEQLGGIPGPAVVGVFIRLPSAGEPVGADQVRVNPKFVEFLHNIIARWAPDDPDLIEAARLQVDGWVYVLDGRTPTPQGRVPTEDVIGAFEVRSGAVVAGSYYASHEYKPFTERGVLKLTPFLHERFVYELTQLPTD